MHIVSQGLRFLHVVSHDTHLRATLASIRAPCAHPLDYCAVHRPTRGVPGLVTSSIVSRMSSLPLSADVNANPSLSARSASKPPSSSPRPPAADAHVNPPQSARSASKPGTVAVGGSSSRAAPPKQSPRMPPRPPTAASATATGGVEKANGTTAVAATVSAARKALQYASAGGRRSANKVAAPIQQAATALDAVPPPLPPSRPATPNDDDALSAPAPGDAASVTRVVTRSDDIEQLGVALIAATALDSASNAPTQRMQLGAVRVASHAPMSETDSQDRSRVSPRLTAAHQHVGVSSVAVVPMLPGISHTASRGSAPQPTPPSQPGAIALAAGTLLRVAQPPFSARAPVSMASTRTRAKLSFDLEVRWLHARSPVTVPRYLSMVLHHIARHSLSHCLIDQLKLTTTKLCTLRTQDLTMHATVGTGTFGRVRVVQHRPSSAYYALKIMKKSEVRHKHFLSHSDIRTRMRNRLCMLHLAPPQSHHRRFYD